MSFRFIVINLMWTPSHFDIGDNDATNSLAHSTTFNGQLLNKFFAQDLRFFFPICYFTLQFNTNPSYLIQLLSSPYPLFKYFLLCDISLLLPYCDIDITFFFHHHVFTFFYSHLPIALRGNPSYILFECSTFLAERFLLYC